ncbi:MAG: ATP-binding protein [Salinirussus sp.]
MAGGRFVRRARENPTEYAMVALWALFTLAYALFFYLFLDAREIADNSLDGYLEVILLGLPSVVLLAGVMWLQESDIEPDLRSRVVVWTVGMAAFFLCAVYTVIFIIDTPLDRGELWLILLMSAGFGASAGTVMGGLKIRSLQAERERNRSRAKARRVERERNQLEHLNHYLRHEVLNEAQKIEGYSRLLGERVETDGSERAWIETIRRSSSEIAEFIQSIREILDASDHEPELEPIDVRAVLDAVAAEFADAPDSVSVTVEGEDSAPVLSGSLLGRAFVNLIQNAGEHNQGDVRVVLSVDRGEEWVTVRVRDDGSGIEVGDQETLFDPAEEGDHGYGLFLTKNLVEVYGGQLELWETGPEGTEFVVRLSPAPETEVAGADTAAPRVRP